MKTSFRDYFIKMQRCKECSQLSQRYIVDATCKLNDMRMPLYVMMVEDSLGQSEVAAVCLLNSDEKPIIVLFVRCFKENNPAFVNTKVIMADKDINERDVFKNEIPNAVLLICQFHVLRTFSR
jgi:hypothetical protein